MTDPQLIGRNYAHCARSGGFFERQRRTERRAEMESRGRSVLGEVRVSDNAAGFVPRREIPRTPPRLIHRNHQPLNTASPAVSTPSKPQERDNTCLLPKNTAVNLPKIEVGGCENDPPVILGSNIEGGGRENEPPINWGSPSNQKRVQALCFTPRRTLERSPSRHCNITTTEDAPPPTRCEIPRTPLVKNPVSPPHNNTAGTQQLPQIESGTSQFRPGSPQKEPNPPKIPSPPIITADKREKRGGVLPHGLVCTENDLAFLQHMENLKQQQKLQRELCELDKAARTAAEEKEQLTHEAKKIQTDLQGMKEKYVETLSSVRSLQLTSDLPNSAHSTSTLPEDLTTVGELSHAHLARLRQTKKLMAVQLEKTDREIEKKISLISQERETLEDKRVKESLNVEELSKDLGNIQLEKAGWEERVRNASDTKHAMEKELDSLQSQLKVSLTVPSAHSPTKPPGAVSSKSTASRERQEAEERLRRLVQRCELYVKRHELLKQLRQI